MSTTIQIRKAQHLHKVGGEADGHIDTAKVRAHADGLLAKHRARGLAHEVSDSSQHGEHEGHTATDHHHRGHHGAHQPAAARGIGKTADVDMIIQGDGFNWIGDLTVGDKTVPLQFDTASTNLVLNKDAYKPGPDAKNQRQHGNVSYASGQTSVVHLWTDTVIFGELPPMKDVPVSWAESNFVGSKDTKMQGLVGLALPGQDSASPLGGFFEKVVKAGVLKENIFSFALAPGGVGELQFGSVSEAATAPAKWLPVLPDRPGEWLVKGSINGLERRMLLDTGSSTILGRKEDVLPLFEKMQEYIEVLEDPDGSIFAVLKDSKKLPDFTFTFGDFSFKLGQDGLFYGTMPDGRQALSIMGDVIMEKFPKDVWIVGDAALREVVYTCDWDGKRVGFSPHKNTIVV